jgi:mannose-6-phosphate isomerase
MPELYPLTGVIRDYAWGSRTAIPQLLGQRPTGAPAAELWLGAHADDSAVVTGTDTSLRDVIAADPPQLLGTGVIERFGPELPFLLKVLAAEHALSIQVHPTRAQARAGFDDEDARDIARTAPERNYRDPNHKPELFCALTDFDALCGFRPVEQTLRLLEELALPQLRPITALLRGPNGLQGAFTAILAFDSIVADAVVEASSRLTGEWADLQTAIVRTAQDFPGDIGLVLMLLLNLVRLRPGEAIFLGAGNVHAYLHGLGVEIMASSDNVLRCGLTSKRIDVPELLRVTEFSALREPRCPVDESAGERRFVVPVPDFGLSIFTLDGPKVTVSADGPQLLLCTDGAATVRAGSELLSLARGQSVFVAAGTSVSLEGVATVFRGRVQ